MKSITLFLFFFSSVLFSQVNTIRVSGYVSDKNNNQPLSGCNIFVEQSSNGTSSDIDGYFQLDLPPGNYKLKFSYVGYETHFIDLKLYAADNEFSLDVFMSLKPYDEDEVTVIGKRESPSTIIQKIEAKDIQHVPNVFSDPIKTVQIFAGVSTNNELSSTYNVRGGSYSENLIYLNGYEIYRPFLLRTGAEENQSLINPDMIDDLSFFNGAFPANYGDKMSSALDVSYSKEHINSLKGKIRADLMNGGITLSNNINGLNIIGGFRFAYPNLFLNTLQTSGDYRPSYSDLQLFANYKFSDVGSIETFMLYANNNYDQSPNLWTGHLRTDRGAAYNQVTIDYDGGRNYSFNTNLVGLRYNDSFNGELIMSVSASWYGTGESEKTDLVGDIYFSPDAERPGVNKELVKTRYEKNDNSINLNSYSFSGNLLFRNGSNEFNFGTDIRLVDVENNLNENLYETAVNTVPQVPLRNNSRDDYSLNSFAFYSQNKVYISDRWIADIGLRYLHYKFTKENLVSPRATILFLADSNQTFNFSWGYFYQPPFLNELKYLSSEINYNLKSQLAIHYVFGWEYYFKPNVKLLVEAYYKNLENLYPFYFENIKMIYVDDFITDGTSFGFDVMFQGEIAGGIESWIGYSYLNSREKNSEGRNPYKRRLLDQTHTIQIFLQDKIPNYPNWKSHLKFLFGSGFLFNPRRIVTNNDGESEFVVTFDAPEEYTIYLRVDMGLSAQFDIGTNKLTATAEVLNLFNQFNIAGYEWIQLFSDYRQPIRIPRILSKRFFNVRLEWSF